jgi:hypothetical protein
VAGMELLQVATTLLKDHAVDAPCEGKIGWGLDASTSQLPLSRSPDVPAGPVVRSVRPIPVRTVRCDRRPPLSIAPHGPPVRPAVADKSAMPCNEAGGTALHSSPRSH